MVTSCVTSRRAGVLGCGATWSGLAMAHCVVCHETFTTNGTADRHWIKGRHVHPADLPAGRLVKRDDGIWRWPGSSDWHQALRGEARSAANGEGGG